MNLQSLKEFSEIRVLECSLGRDAGIGVVSEHPSKKIQSKVIKSEPTYDVLNGVVGPIGEG